MAIIDAIDERRINRLVEKHRSGSGLIVLGQYFPLRLPVGDHDWRRVMVITDGHDVLMSLSQQARRPKWAALQPGRYQVVFCSAHNIGDVLREYEIDLAAHQIAIVRFRPGNRISFRGPIKESWALEICDTDDM